MKEVTKNGDVRLTCPALSGKVTCPLRAGDKQAMNAAAKKGAAGRPSLPITPKHAPKKQACGDVCKKKSVTIALSDPDAVRFNKYHQQGPPAYTEDWRSLYKVYRARNEGANAIIKAESGIGIGDRTKKGIRGFTGVAIRTACAVVVANVRLYVNHLKRLRDSELPEPPNPGGRPPRKKLATDFVDLAGPNAPPKPHHKAA